jgi:hypothetical protein
MTLADRINTQLAALNLLPLTSEQLACLADPAHLDEAAAMLDDLAARCGVRLPLPEGVETGPFKSEEEAREEAEEQIQRYDAVALDEMATDEGRSYGNNEYYLIGFNGPDAAIAAACKGYITYWVKGQERDDDV